MTKLQPWGKLREMFSWSANQKERGQNSRIRRGYLCSAGGQRFSLWSVCFAGWWRENCELLVGLDLDAQVVMAAACYGRGIRTDFTASSHPHTCTSSHYLLLSLRLSFAWSPLMRRPRMGQTYQFVHVQLPQGDSLTGPLVLSTGTSFLGLMISVSRPLSVTTEIQQGPRDDP